MMPRIPLSGPLGLSLAAMLLVLVFLLASVPSLLVAAFGSGLGDTNATEELVLVITRHSESTCRSIERFNGRSAFFRPPVVEPPIVIPPQGPDEGPTTQPILRSCPDRYTGPTMIGFVGDEVWFKPRTTDELVLRIPVGYASEDLEVVSTNLPWTARVSLNGCTYDLSLWNRSDESLFQPNPSRAIRGLQFEPMGVAQ